MMTIDEMEKLVQQQQAVEYAARELPKIKARQQLEARQQAAQEKANELDQVVSRRLAEFEQKRHESQIRLRALVGQIKMWIEDNKLLQAEAAQIYPIVEEMLKARIIAQQPERGDNFGRMDEHVREEYRRRVKRPVPISPNRGWSPLFYALPNEPDTLFDTLLTLIVGNVAHCEIDDPRPRPAADFNIVGSNGR